MAHVLLLEPDSILANTYMKALEQVGHDVACCTTAEDALRAMDDMQPHVVVLELQLVGYDGIGFLHELRSYTDGLALPVVVNTNIPPGLLRPLVEVMGRDLGVKVCLYKPRTTLQQLVRTVQDQVRPA
jgi:DNA-binding response OmpR family regulator